jgi:glycerophosphoryl diester phosphodiesterase
MIIFSHRGIGFGRIENSLDAFKEALVKGFSLEVDVQLSLDGKLFVLHDSSLFRTYGVDKLLVDVCSDELEKIGVIKFEEVLILFLANRVLGSKIAVHIKDETQDNVVEKVCELLINMNCIDSCFIFDITKEKAVSIKQKYDVQVGISLGEKRYSSTVYVYDDLKEFKDYDIVWLDEWHSGLYNFDFIDKVKNIGKKVYVISPELHVVHKHPMGNSLESVKRVWDVLLDVGVDGVCTDYPVELNSGLDSN